MVQWWSSVPPGFTLRTLEPVCIATNSLALNLQILIASSQASVTPNMNSQHIIPKMPTPKMSTLKNCPFKKFQWQPACPWRHLSTVRYLGEAFILFPFSLLCQSSLIKTSCSWSSLTGCEITYIFGAFCAFCQKCEILEDNISGVDNVGSWHFESWHFGNLKEPLPSIISRFMTSVTPTH